MPIGKPMPTLDKATLAANVEILNGCWIWSGDLSKDGYGRWGRLAAYRLSYELYKGPIPAGMHIDHLCFNPPCVRPDHLQAVEPTANNRRKLKSLAEECSKGHKFTPENTGRQGGGRRFCRICDRAAQRRRYRERQQRKAA